MATTHSVDPWTQGLATCYINGMSSVFQGCLVCGRESKYMNGLQPIFLIGLAIDQGLCSMECVRVFAMASVWGEPASDHQ